jgi:phosphotriesterase-related protein
MQMIRTVRGDVAPSTLGRVNYHEHFFQASPLLPGDELDDEDRSTTEAVDVRAHGIETVVDATPIGLGRRPESLRRLSERSGLHVIASTGVHRPEHYATSHWIHDLDEEGLAAWFHADLTRGCVLKDAPQVSDDNPARTDVCAGLIKVGIGYWSLPPLARRSIAAAGIARAATGAPMMIHLEHCSAGHEVLNRLEEEGVPASAVALAHVDRVPDPGLHASLAARGAYLGYDGCARYAAWPESVLLECMADVLARGHGDKVLLGGDVARASRFLAYGGMPGMRYLTQRYVPRIRESLGDDVQKMLIVNPANWLTWRAHS